MSSSSESESESNTSDQEKTWTVRNKKSSTKTSKTYQAVKLSSNVEDHVPSRKSTVKRLASLASIVDDTRNAKSSKKLKSKKKTPPSAKEYADDNDAESIHSIEKAPTAKKALSPSKAGSVSPSF